MKEETQSQLLASIHICTCAHTLMNIHTRTCTSHTKYNKIKQNSQSRTAVSRGGSVRHGDMSTNVPKLAGRQNEPIDSTKYSTRFIVRICIHCLKLLRFLDAPHPTYIHTTESVCKETCRVIYTSLSNRQKKMRKIPYYSENLLKCKNSHTN